MCGTSLGVIPKAFFFAHILPKGTYSRFRLEEENIALLCWDCHTKYDHETHKAKSEWLFRKLFEKFETLKQKYNNIYLL